MKSLNYRLALTFVIFTSFLFGQTTNAFRVNYNVGMLDLPAGAIESHTAGNFVFAGTNATFLPIIGSITELDPTGTIVWSKSYSGGLAYQLNDIKKDPAGGYYACGGSSSSSGIFLRVDATGNYLDANKFDLANATGEYLNRVVKTSDGGYVAAGYSYGYDPDGAGGQPKNDSTTALVVKFDASGNRLWHHVFRFYSDAGKTNPILNDGSFVDVVEVSDGYIFVGRYEVDDVINVNSDGDDVTPDDAIILKTTTAGVITYLKQLDTPSSSGSQTSKTFNSISKTVAGLPLISGSDGNQRPLMVYRMLGSGGWVAPTWSQKYGIGGLLGYNVMEPSQFFETSDGKYAVMGMYINPLGFDFSQFLMKFEPATYATIFTKKYSFSLAVILPVGQQVSDGGYLSLSTTMAGTGFDYHVIKTDPTGATGATCAEATLAPTTSTAPNTWADPYYNSWNADVVDNANVTPVITTITPVSTVQCLTVVNNPCTPPAAATTVTSSPASICVGQSTTITAAGSATGVVYNVYGTATGGTSLGVTPLLVSPAATTTYYVETVNSTDPACVSTTRTSVTVTVTSPETITVTGTNALCNGGTGSATVATTGTGPYTYAWTPSGGSTATASNLTPGTYSVSVTNPAGCVSTGSAVITQPAVIGLVANSTQSSCTSPTGTASVVASGGAVPYTYSWAPSGGSASTASGLAVGVYTVTVTDANGCTKTATATVNSANGPTVSIASSTNASCFGSTNGTATAVVSGGTPGYTYVWTPSGGNAASATGLGAGTYTITATDNAGCSAVQTVTISAPAQINVTTSGTDAGCGVSDGSATAIASGGNGPYTYSWQPGNVNGATISNVPGGVYTVTVTDASTCTTTANYTVAISGTLNVAVTPLTSVIDAGQSVNLTATVTPNIPGLVYSWTPTAGLSCTNCANPVASPAQTTTYTVTATSPDGCAGNASANVQIRIICGEHFVPTIFSPNGDGSNDLLCMMGTCIVKMNFRIYDRWGEKVFESTDPEICWDGTYKGKLMNPASFVYTVDLVFIDGRSVTEKGNITLVR